MLKSLFQNTARHIYGKFQKPLTNRLQALESRCSELESHCVNLQNELTQVRDRTINYYKNRWDVLDSVVDYLVNAELPGEYAEFGVFKGSTFGYCANLFGPLFSTMRFLAFDSFEGLPEPGSIDKVDGFSSGFFKGQFACSEEDFLRNVLNAAPNLDPQRIVTVPGWFDKTLHPETAQKLRLEKLACIWIDCDLYESTVPVLRFITPLLSVGTVILFDDWRSYRNLPDFSQQKACAEWLEANPALAITPFISFGSQGQSFTVRVC